MGRGSVGWEILGFLMELVLDRGSFELTDVLPAPDELDRENHFVGLVRKPVMPDEGDAERGVLR